jgi:hypothetical protein
MLFAITYLDCYGGKNRILVYSLAVAFLALLAGTAYGIHSDFEAYRRAFTSLRSLPQVFSVFSSFEPGFLALMLGFKQLFPNFFLFYLFIISLCVCLSGNSFFRYSSAPFIVVFLFFCSGYMPLSFQVMRQGIAAALFLFSLRYIADGRKWIAFLLCALACTFHYSAIVLLPIVFFADFKGSRKLYAILSILLLLYFTLRIDLFRFIVPSLRVFLEPKLPHIWSRLALYLGDTAVQGAPVRFSLNYIRTIAVLCVAVFYYDDLAKDSKIFRVLFNLFFINFVVMNLFNMEVIFYGRLRYYFQTDYLLIPFFFKYLDRPKRRLLYAFLLLLYGGLCISTFFYSNGTGWVLDYKSWLFSGFPL